MRRSPRWFWVLAIGLALAWLGAPAPVQASCGAYVVIGSPHVQADSPSSGKAAPGPLAGGMRMLHDAPGAEKPAKPCSGPHCSRQRSPLTPAPTTTPAPEDERWGHNALAALLPEVAGTLFYPPLPVRSPVRGSSSIYHPPR